MSALQACLLFSSALFALGLAAALARRTAILVLLALELMLSAGTVNLVAFWRYGPRPADASGLLFVLFAIAISAAEAGVGLALVIAVRRHHASIRLDQPARLKG
ncbi:MAG TPA: NADH-quinone oxidoreductase subunit NuoK [Opitutaceae bacterium]|jgi:NADH-quinone oxidoreductase subunit K|nr:NADH-quinone oxidoreductase subunit NuoK [Opitutaceae bacterium]